MQQPPLLPEETFARVLRLAKFDGLGALIMGTVFALMAGMAGDAPFAVIGLLAAGAGAVELHGVALLREGYERGMRWLVASQPFLLMVILGYCLLRLTHFEMPPIPPGFQELVAASAQQWRMSIEDYFRMINAVAVGVLAIVSCVYQGAMAVYYLRRRAAVQRALAESE